MRFDGNKRLFDPQGKGVAIGPDGGLFKNIRIYRVEADFASVADGADGGLDLACSGVALGDVVMGVAVDVDPGDDVLITGQVTATDIVRATLFNRSGGAVDLAATTATIIVAQRQT